MISVEFHGPERDNASVTTFAAQMSGSAKENAWLKVTQAYQSVEPASR